MNFYDKWKVTEIFKRFFDNFAQKIAYFTISIKKVNFSQIFKCLNGDLVADYDFESTLLH